LYLAVARKDEHAVLILEVSDNEKGVAALQGELRRIDRRRISHSDRLLKKAVAV